MARGIDRRRFLQGSGALAGAAVLNGCAKHTLAATPQAAPAVGRNALPFYDIPGTIVPIRADMDRIFRITACLRPFRATGPRLDVERVGDKVVIHNYGHGGSGWSLSWGSADVVVRRAMEVAPGLREVAVIGCGALGLTAALTAQRMGMQATIYARERPPYVRSSRATGSWTPDSRIALKGVAPVSFAAEWEAMARTSFNLYQSYLGAPGTPIEWTDRYKLDDGPVPRTYEEQHNFATYASSIRDIIPRWTEMPPGSTPFPTKNVIRNSSLTFNVATYSRTLMQEFQIGGGRIETREFHTPAELAGLTQAAVLNCTGYGARQLWSDESVVPVRGQIAWLIPQEGVNYGLYYNGLSVLARRDGIVIQPFGDKGDDTGWNDTNEQPDREEAEAGVRVLQQLYARMAAGRERTGNRL